MRLKRSLPLGQPFGIPLLVHGSWFPAAALLVTHFVLTVFSGEPAPAAIGLSVIATLAFFACLTAHELGHALVARGLGLPVVDITLFVFGGIARIAREPTRPVQEIVIALAGPFVSAVLGGTLLVFSGALSGPIGTLVWTIAAANVVLAVFNLLPGFPLDGGRVLRAAIWSRTGDPYRAARVAGSIGQGIGLVLAVVGLATFLSVGPFAVEGVTPPGPPEALWLTVVGAFLYVLATASRRAARLAATLHGEEAGGWARPFAGTVRADAPMTMVHPDGSVPYAVSRDGRLAGVLVPGRSRFQVSAATAAELMVPWSPRLAFRASDPLTRALERLASDSQGLLVVVDETGSVVGVLDRDVIRQRLRSGGR